MMQSIYSTLTLLFDELAWSLSHSDSDDGTEIIILFLFLVGGGSSSRLPSELSSSSRKSVTGSVTGVPALMDRVIPKLLL